MILALLVFATGAVVYRQFFSAAAKRAQWVDHYVAHYESNLKPRRLTAAQCEKVLAAARSQLQIVKEYDPSYSQIPFPAGDVEPSKGVCADVIVRSFRAVDIDLQALVNQELLLDFASSPQIWRLQDPDSNIDHRRVPNLMWYMTRHWSTRPLSKDPQDFRACDVVAWDLGLGVTHIGIVTDQKAADSDLPLILHHISGWPKEENVLNEWRKIGHYAF